MSELYRALCVPSPERRSLLKKASAEGGRTSSSVATIRSRPWKDNKRPLVCTRPRLELMQMLEPKETAFDMKIAVRMGKGKEISLNRPVAMATRNFREAFMGISYSDLTSGAHDQRRTPNSIAAFFGVVPDRRTISYQGDNR